MVSAAEEAASELSVFGKPLSIPPSVVADVGSSSGNAEIGAEARAALEVPGARIFFKLNIQPIYIGCVLWASSDVLHVPAALFRRWRKLLLLLIPVVSRGLKATRQRIRI